MIFNWNRSFKIALLALAMTAASVPAIATRAITNPGRAKVEIQGRQQFHAYVEGVQAGPLVWAVAGIAGGNTEVGTISPFGVYTAPAEPLTSPVAITAIDPKTNAVLGTSFVSVESNQEVEEARARWVSGVEEAASHYGCRLAAVQQPGESVEEAIKLFVAVADNKSCLALLPVSSNPAPGRYSMSWGGKVDGIDIFYISDVGQSRIWNGMPSAD